eukprot:CAMPEP_0118698072 /NCGR_PEP_ID=MMETSP0800-20121206/14962_1 /TAXON_ID=210618 ORGANISM="Striatella unipunctata, Strain CCMP2910" /NCGR_SAMPLE_ID=MMETSP0800 /ASSEMBLY_ACC=CAM_ASM_000638 /LENGTH=133 /DNA_ID=CAMNT_0006597781 /DNA_START=36 /DNA_END=437 /DNA_ORIENTATION=-
MIDLAFDLFRLIHANKWSIIFALIVVWQVKANFLDDYVAERRHQKSMEEANDPERVRILDRDRERRLEEMQERQRKSAMEALKKKKDQPEQPVPKTKKKKPQPRSSGYNPMDPSSSSSSGPGYKPPKRKVQRS